MAIARNVSKLRLSIDMILQRFNRSIDNFLWSFWRNGPALAIAGPSILQPQPGQSDQKGKGFALQDLLDGFLWAVPKHRRSKERNRTRRRAPEKRVSYNTSLVPCEVCGNLRQTGFLCGHCLTRIRDETKDIQDKLFGELDKEGAIPDRENVLLYEGETLTEADQHNRAVEIKKRRPSWFSRELTGRTCSIKW